MTIEFFYFFMKNRIFHSLTITFLIILNLTFGNFFLNRVSAQNVSEDILLSLPFRQCWSYETKMTNHKIASDNEGRIIIPTLEGKILALDSNSGIKLWETELGGEIISDLINDGENKSIYVATNSFSSIRENNINNSHSFSHTTIKLRSLGKTTGITNWQTTLLTGASNKKSKIFVFIYNHKIITTDQSGNITALSKEDGEVLWKKSLTLKMNNTHFDLQGKNLIALSEKSVVLVDIETGEHVFQKETDSIFTAVFFFNRTTLILGNKKGEVFAIDTKSRKNIWKFRAGAEISNISFTPKGLLVTSFDNFIYLAAAESGRIIWKRRLEGRLIIEPFLITNSIIVVSLGSSKATILDLSDGKPINQVYLFSNNYFVSHPVFNNRIIILPTADGIFAFTNSDDKCAVG